MTRTQKELTAAIKENFKSGETISFVNIAEKLNGKFGSCYELYGRLFRLQPHNIVKETIPGTWNTKAVDTTWEIL